MGRPHDFLLLQYLLAWRKGADELSFYGGRDYSGYFSKLLPHPNTQVLTPENYNCRCGRLLSHNIAVLALIS
jgi:hypothetical protein